MTVEYPAQSISGYLLLLLMLLALAACGAGVEYLPGVWKLLSVVGLLVVIFCGFGFYMVQPNQGKVMQLFGRYAGTDRASGLRWSNPLYSKSSVSLRVRNFESGRLKVNDANGNPIEIAAIIVWRVVDTAEAVFEVDSYENYVTIQSESALRNLATSYPYEDHDDDGHRLSLQCQ